MIKSENSDKYHLKFNISDLPETTNSGGRQHWSHKVRQAKRWKWLVGLRIGHHKPLEPLKKAKIVLTRASSRVPDADGLVSSFKHVIDGLVVHDVILDDSMTVIGMPEYKWTKAPPKNGYIEVEVFEA